jgi:hypothetical protein
MVVQLSKDFVRVAKRLAARAKKNGILPPVIAIGRGRAEASDGFVVVSVPAAHEGEVVAGFDPAKLKATHGAEVGTNGHVVQQGERVAGAQRLKAWPDFGPRAEAQGIPFRVEPQLLIDALDAFPKNGSTVRVYLPSEPGQPVVILGSNGERALLMPQEEVQ